MTQVEPAPVGHGELKTRLLLLLSFSFNNFNYFDSVVSLLVSVFSTLWQLAYKTHDSRSDQSLTRHGSRQRDAFRPISVSDLEILTIKSTLSENMEKMLNFTHLHSFFSNLWHNLPTVWKKELDLIN